MAMMLSQYTVQHQKKMSSSFKKQRPIKPEIIFFFFVWCFEPIPDHGLPLGALAITLRQTSLSRILWTSDRPDAETFTGQHTTLTEERHL